MVTDVNIVRSRYSRKRVENGSYKTMEDDILTLASLRLQVEKGDHHPINTPLAIKPVLSDYIPQHLKKAQPAKEWLEDLCATHSQMKGFEAGACKENYIRITMGFDNFGYTCYQCVSLSISASLSRALSRPSFLLLPLPLHLSDFAAYAVSR